MFSKSFTLLTSLPKQRVRKWLGKFETIICDADGVLWKFGKAIDGAPDVFNMLQTSGVKMFVVSNSSDIPIPVLIKMANKFGINVEEHQYLTPTLALRDFLVEKKFEKKLYLVGNQGIADQLTKMNLCTIIDNPDVHIIPQVEFAQNLKLDPNVGAVVVAKDDHFCVHKIITACCYLKNPKIPFIGFGLDGGFPLPNKSVLIGPRAMITPIKQIGNRTPLILGKPNPRMVNKLQKCGLANPEKTLMIGDTVYTDILFGHNCGFATLLVLSGVSSLEDVEKLRESKDENKLAMVPDLYVPSLGDLLEFLC